jgi:hypothetical protein
MRPRFVFYRKNTLFTKKRGFSHKNEMPSTELDAQERRGRKESFS